MAELSDGGVSEDLQDMLLELKDTSELMVDLAYSSLLYNNRDIAEEVHNMRSRAEELRDVLQELAIARAIEGRDANTALIIIRMARSALDISDAAMRIADVVRLDMPVHPVVRLSLRESDVIITTAIVHEGSDLEGTTLGATKLSTNSGMRVIAIKRGPRYIYGPDRTTTIMAGDVLFARGPEDGEAWFKDLAAGQEHLTPKDLVQ